MTLPNYCCNSALLSGLTPASAAREAERVGGNPPGWQPSFNPNETGAQFAPEWAIIWEGEW